VGECYFVLFLYSPNIVHAADEDGQFWGSIKIGTHAAAALV